MLSPKFNRISDTLEEHCQFWQNEIIELYPRCLEMFPQEWIEDLERLGDEELYQFERLDNCSALKSKSLINYCKKMRSISHFDFTPEVYSCQLSNETLLRINDKKRHEIQSILGTLEQLQNKYQLKQLVDLGGGIGNLARIVAKQYRVPSSSIDYNYELQKTGKKRYQSYLPDYAADIAFFNRDILALKELPAGSMKKGQNSTICLGLHTCGALANAQINLALKANLPMILNYSCCYNKMLESDYFISHIGKQRNLKLGISARVLASHTPRKDRKSHNDWKCVKTFRYLIHLFFYHELGITEFRPLGTCPAWLYQGGFSDYAKVQIERINLSWDDSMQKQVEAFLANPHYQKIAKKMILANSIRSFAGRPIEALLVLDRGMYLEEHNYSVQIRQHFDPFISPRNLGILAISKKNFSSSGTNPKDSTH